MSGEGLAIRIERVVPAPRDAAFRAHVEPAELARWWGPRGFTVPAADIDARVGGRYRIAMQPPEGPPFHVEGEFREVEPTARLAYTFRWEPPAADDRETTVLVTFEDLGDATRVTVRQGDFATAERLALHRDGWSDTLDRLVEHLSG